MILYFSGTGNSRYVAKIIQRITNDDIASINDFMKKEIKASFNSTNPFVVVVPIYAWKIPKIVDTFIRNSDFIGSNDIYFIFTCASESHNAVHYVKNICTDKNLHFKGCSTVIMPSNYILMPGVPDKIEASLIIKNATIEATSIGYNIKNNQFLKKEKITNYSKFMSKFINPLFYKFYVNSKSFYVTNSCTSCKKCISLCPINNVKMEGNKPIWGKKCTHCMACICGCPNESIEYKNKSEGKPRYYLDEFYINE